ncbi:MAG: spore cortex biosynthesis protein YabQ [Clostridia bacterium]|nr:spore cortex biosynthesis protein YabQ [Clostridia bacterium]
MIYSEPLFNQVSRFITSIGFGFVICILYLAVVFMRMLVSDRKWAIIAQDIIFGITATVMSFFFMVLYNNGEVRWNLVFGEFIGAGVLYFTVGRYALSFLKKAAGIIRKITGLVLMPVVLYLKAFPSFFSGIIRSCKQKNEKRVKKKNKKRKYSQNPLEKSE